MPSSIPIQDALTCNCIRNGYLRQDTPGLGQCFFHVIREAKDNGVIAPSSPSSKGEPIATAQLIRLELMKHIEDNITTYTTNMQLFKQDIKGRLETDHEYLERMRRPNEFVDHFVVETAAKYFHCDFVIYTIHPSPTVVFCGLVNAVSIPMAFSGEFSTDVHGFSMLGHYEYLKTLFVHFKADDESWTEVTPISTRLSEDERILAQNKRITALVEKEKKGAETKYKNAMIVVQTELRKLKELVGRKTRSQTKVTLVYH